MWLCHHHNYGDKELKLLYSILHNLWILIDAKKHSLPGCLGMLHYVALYTTTGLYTQVCIVIWYIAPSSWLLVLTAPLTMQGRRQGGTSGALAHPFLGALILFRCGLAPPLWSYHCKKSGSVSAMNHSTSSKIKQVSRKKKTPMRYNSWVQICSPLRYSA